MLLQCLGHTSCSINSSNHKNTDGGIDDCDDEDAAKTCTKQNQNDALPLSESDTGIAKYKQVQ